MLLGAALILFAPLSLIDAIPGLSSEVESDVEAIDVVRAVAVGVSSMLLTLLGAVVYGVIVSSLVRRQLRLHSPRLADTLRAIPYTRALAADLVHGLVVAAGLLLLIAPSLVFMTWFALIAPAIELEGRSALGAFRRSRDLVRPHFWRVFALVVPLALGSDLVSGLIYGGALGAFGETFAGDWSGALLGELITAPFLALVVVVTYLELIGAGSADTPARAGL